MALRWHVGLPGPFSASGRVVPRGSGILFGSVLIVAVLIWVVAKLWWVLVATAVLWLAYRWTFKRCQTCGWVKFCHAGYEACPNGKGAWTPREATRSAR